MVLTLIVLKQRALYLSARFHLRSTGTRKSALIFLLGPSADFGIRCLRMWKLSWNLSHGRTSFKGGYIGFITDLHSRLPGKGFQPWRHIYMLVKRSCFEVHVQRPVSLLLPGPQTYAKEWLKAFEKSPKTISLRLGPTAALEGYPR